MKKQLTQFLNKIWYDTSIPWFLTGPSLVYRLGQYAHARWSLYRAKANNPIPVIVIGNLTVGGTGKTPLLITLAKQLTTQGVRVGIITRGYQSKHLKYPHLVQATDDVHDIGDEAALIAQKTKLPVVISPQRHLAIDYLYQHNLCDLILSDDGLQHLAMPRQMELVVIDGERGFGNQALLPLGPLREPISRLASVDFILVNGPMSSSLSKTLAAYTHKTYHISLAAQAIYPHNQQQSPFSSQKPPFAAFAGIGNPNRFFKHLKSLNLEIKCYPFPDHHRYRTNDFLVKETAIIMTEKDAVKCPKIGTKPIYILPVEACLSPSFWDKFSLASQGLISCKKY